MFACVGANGVGSRSELVVPISCSLLALSDMLKNNSTNSVSHSQLGSPGRSLRVLGATAINEEDADTEREGDDDLDDTDVDAERVSGPHPQATRRVLTKAIRSEDTRTDTRTDARTDTRIEDGPFLRVDVIPLPIEASQ